MTTLEERIERLESLDSIRQLVSKYSLALDVRDLDAMVSLFPDNVKVGKNNSGRLALKKWFDATLRDQFTGTAHHIGNHIIDFNDSHNAHGVVYSKNEHETENEWIIMQMMYWDDYISIDGTWFFKRRLPLYWYASDLNHPPIGNNKMRWPGIDPYEGEFHSLWPSWKEFWAHDNDLSDVNVPIKIDNFLMALRRNSEIPSIKVK